MAGHGRGSIPLCGWSRMENPQRGFSTEKYPTGIFFTSPALCNGKDFALCGGRTGALPQYPAGWPRWPMPVPRRGAESLRWQFAPERSASLQVFVLRGTCFVKRALRVTNVVTYSACESRIVLPGTPGSARLVLTMHLAGYQRCYLLCLRIATVPPGPPGTARLEKGGDLNADSAVWL